MRPYDRTYAGANLLEDLPLYRLLYRLTELTGDTNYAVQADLSIDWFLTHAQSAVTDLYCWGSHMNWDVRSDAPVYNDGTYGGHEYNIIWPYWENHPTNLQRFAYGLWDNQIHNQGTGNFSRHAGYFARSTASGYEFPRTGGCYIDIWAREFGRSGVPEMKQAIQTLLGLYRSMRDPTTGAMSWCTSAGEDRRDVASVHMNLAMATTLQDAAEHVDSRDPALAEEMRELARFIDDEYLSNDYDMILDVAGEGILTWYTIAERDYMAKGILPPPEDGDASIGYPLETDAGGPAASLYNLAPWFVNRSYARAALLLLDRHDRCIAAHKPLYLQAVLETADIYMTIAPEVQFVLYADDVADVVELLRRCHNLTGNAAYLRRADAMMPMGVQLFFDEVSPLPKISSFDDWYESSSKNGSSISLLEQMLELAEDLDALPPDQRTTPVEPLVADAAMTAASDAGGMTLAAFHALLTAAVAADLGGRWDGSGLTNSSKDVELTYGAVTNRRDLYLSQVDGVFSTNVQQGVSFDLSISDVIDHIPTAEEADAANVIVPGGFTGSEYVYESILYAGFKNVLTGIGIVVSNDAAQAQEVTFEVTYYDTYHDNGSNTLTAVIPAGQSTFFGMQAPSRKCIRRVHVTSLSGTPVTLADLGFVLSPRSTLNPLPSEPVNIQSNYWYQATVSANNDGPLDLLAELNYNTGQANAPVAVVMHGYSPATGNLGNVRANAQRLRDHGFFAISVALRGRDGSDGVRDSGGLEIHDIYDAVEAVKADPAFAGLIDPTNVHITGYSGGGGNTMSALTKFPDYFRLGASFFGMSDYGFDPTNGWYNNGAAANHLALMNSDVGNPNTGGNAVLDKYQARASNLASRNNPYSEIHLFVNSSETTCPPVNNTSYRDNAVAAASFAGEFDNITVHAGGLGVYEDFNGNSVNDPNELQSWPHGFPSSNQQDAAELWYRDRLLAGTVPPPVLNNSDSLFVAGFVKTARFGLWLGDGQNAGGDVAYSFSDTSMSFSLALGSSDPTVTGELSIDTAQMAGETVEVRLNGSAVDSFVGGGQYTYNGLGDGDSLLLVAGEAVVHVTGMSASAPTDNVAISQTAVDNSTPFRWNRAAGTDRCPRDAGQSFLVGAEGFVLDRITVNLSAAATAAYDSQPITVEIFSLTDESDVVPDHTVASESLSLPDDMKAAFDAGNTYLTIDISDVTLDAGRRYGFLLMHDALQSMDDNMLLAAKANSGYTDGIGITREQRGTAGDIYKATTVWTGSSQPADLEFYLQSAPPAGTVLVIR